jgi:asparagine synthase (glutamine-hydrolysing)
MNTGFTITASEERVCFRTFGAATFISLGRCGRNRAILMGRLYYRDDVLAMLPATVSARDPNDAELALAVYRHKGPRALSRLEGDFAVAIWDGYLKQLVACRDPLGGFPLAWVRHCRTIALSTSQQALLDHLPSRRLNSDYLAEFLMLPGCGHHELSTDHCPYEGIHRLLGGHLLFCRLPSCEVKQERCWNWLEHVRDAGSDHLEDQAAALRKLLEDAIRERTRSGKTASHFSGGMDSTSVALLAGRLARKPVAAVSMVYERLPVLQRETAYIDAALENAPSLVSRRVKGDDSLDFDDLDETPWMDEPCPNLSRFGAERKLVEAAAEAGAGTLLTGQGADEFLDPPPNHIAELLKGGRVLGAWRESSAWGRFLGRNGARVFAEYGIGNLLPSWLCSGLGAALRGCFTSWNRQGDYSIPPWIRPEFARAHDLRGRALAHARSMRAVQPLNLARTPSLLERRQGDLARWHAGVANGVLVTHPFLDTRVLGFGLGLQSRFTPCAGKQKPILAEAMSDVLPESIRNRVHKGHFNEVSFGGLSRNLPRLEELIESAPTDNLGLLDKPSLRDCLRRAALGVAADIRASDRLGLTLALLQWLTSVESRPPTARHQVVWTVAVNGLSQLCAELLST